MFRNLKFAFCVSIGLAIPLVISACRDESQGSDKQPFKVETKPISTEPESATKKDSAVPVFRKTEEEIRSEATDIKPFVKISG